MERIERAQDQIAEAIRPVLDIGRLVDHIILSAIFECHIFERLDCVFAAWMNKEADAALGSFDHPVCRVDLVFDGPRCLGTDAAEAKAPNDVVIRPAC